MLEKGFFLDSKGIKVNTKNALFVFLINQESLNNSTFNLFCSNKTNIKNQVEDTLGYKFVNLIDEIVEFDCLNQTDYKKIVINELLKKNLFVEMSSIPDIDESELKINGGNAALRKVKEVIKEKNIKKLIKK